MNNKLQKLIGVGCQTNDNCDIQLISYTDKPTMAEPETALAF